jgi:hypothetical protein
MTELRGDVAWQLAGRRLARHLQEGKLASVAHTARRAIEKGVFADKSDWRTACLTFMPLDVIVKIGKRRKKAKRNKPNSSSSASETGRFAIRI